MSKVFCGLFLVVALATLVVCRKERTRSDKTVKITSPRITNVGDWGEWAYCPPGKFVNGMKLKIQLENVKSIRLFCTAPGEGSDYALRNEIQSLEGPSPYGSYDKESFCPEDSFAEGFELRTSKKGASNLKLLCNDENGEDVEGGGKSNGKWTDPKECPEGELVCGFKIQVDPEGYSWGTGVNNVDMQCCTAPHASAGKEPEFLYA